MPDKRQQIRDELQQLITEGFELYFRELFFTMTPSEREHAIAQLDSNGEPAREQKADPEVEAAVETLVSPLRDKSKPDFGREYNSWYSAALPAVRLLLPDRYEEFLRLYQPARRARDDLDVMTYGIADYISKLTVTQGYLKEPVFDTRTVALGRFNQQIAILRTAERRLDSLLADMVRELQAGIFDAELDSAHALLKAKHVRAAGAIAGVVLEQHLGAVVQQHAVSLGRKKATLAVLNDALKDAEVYDTAQWRRLQHLADVRNLCAHSGDRQPTADDVEDLLSGVERAIKTVF